MTEGRDAERDCGITIKPTLVLGDWGEKWRERPLFLSPGSLQFFWVLFSILKESKGLGQSLHLLTQSDNSWSTSLSFLNFVFQCKFVHLCCCFTESLQDFKSEVHKLFPLIYDTKFLAYEIRKNPVSK